MTKTTTLHDACWDREQRMYLCPTLCGGCWSEDGDTWYDDHGGHPMASEEFVAATITLVGGPRDGEIVS